MGAFTYPDPCHHPSAVHPSSRYRRHPPATNLINPHLWASCSFLCSCSAIIAMIISCGVIARFIIRCSGILECTLLKAGTIGC